MSLVDQLLQQMGPNGLKALSQQLGLNEDQTNNAIEQTLPMLMGAMARQTATEKGTNNFMQILDRNHDGSIMDDLIGFLGSSDNKNGPNILDAILGGKRGQVENTAGHMAGLDAGTIGKLFENLAPVLIGMLQGQRGSRGLNPGAISGMLGQESSRLQTNNGSTAMQVINSILDKDNDGSMVDDVVGMFGKFMSKKR